MSEDHSSHLDHGFSIDEREEALNPEPVDLNFSKISLLSSLDNEIQSIELRKKKKKKKPSRLKNDEILPSSSKVLPSDSNQLEGEEYNKIAMTPDEVDKNITVRKHNPGSQKKQYKSQELERKEEGQIASDSGKKCVKISTQEGTTTRKKKRKKEVLPGNATDPLPLHDALPSTLFRHLNPSSDIKYRDQKPKLVGHFILGRTIGEGSYAKVKEAIDIKTRGRVAVKIFGPILRSRALSVNHNSLMREIAVMQVLHHDNIVNIIYHFIDPETSKFYLVFDHVSCGTLSTLLDTAPNNRLPPKQAQRVFSGLICGLEYLKSLRVVHQDIKPDNLLITSSGQVKISDFGVAQHLVGMEAPPVPFSAGSPAFQAPELIRGSSMTFSSPDAPNTPYKSDVWSAGIVLYIIVVGAYPFPNHTHIMTLFDDITNARYVVPDWVDPLCRDLIQKMLHVDPVSRIDVTQIKSHPWFTASLPDTPFVPLRPLPSMWQRSEDVTAVIATMSSLMKKNALPQDRSRQSNRVLSIMSPRTVKSDPVDPKQDCCTLI